MHLFCRIPLPDVLHFSNHCLIPMDVCMYVCLSFLISPLLVLTNTLTFNNDFSLSAYPVRICELSLSKSLITTGKEGIASKNPSV